MAEDLALGRVLRERQEGSRAPREKPGIPADGPPSIRLRPWTGYGQVTSKEEIQRCREQTITAGSYVFQQRNISPGRQKNQQSIHHQATGGHIQSAFGPHIHRPTPSGRADHLVDCHQVLHSSTKPDTEGSV
ncbi:UNVERIFIED_CONTAM: hypothetical protein PYX00_001750 [Menopon gallinae]|uniref:Uncharacterized protein n=1 Tax=Menopon gallinae TaxID=328185 RepID=A0AAW2IFM7_9NEOP